MTRRCQYCGGDITHLRSTAKFCSPKHKALWHKQKGTAQTRMVRSAPPVPPVTFTPASPDPVTLSQMPLQPFLQWSGQFPTLVQGILLKWYEDGTLARLETHALKPEEVSYDPVLDDIGSAVLRKVAEAVAATPTKD